MILHRKCSICWVFPYKLDSRQDATLPVGRERFLALYSISLIFTRLPQSPHWYNFISTEIRKATFQIPKPSNLWIWYTVSSTRFYLISGSIVWLFFPTGLLNRPTCTFVFNKHILPKKYLFKAFKFELNTVSLSILCFNANTNIINS